MKYNDLVNLVKDIAQTVNPNGTFVHARRTDGSLEYAGAMPQIHLYPFSTGINLDTATDTSQLTVAFWYQDSPDSSPTETQALMDDAETLCRSFLAEFTAQAGDNQIQIGDVRIEPQYRTLSATLSGFAAQINITHFTSPC